MLPLFKQLQILSWLLLTGVILAFAYQLYSSFGKGRRGATLFMDLFFLFGMTTLVVMSLYLIRWGELRFFYLLTIALGFLLYRSLLTPFFKGVLSCMRGFFKPIKKNL